MIIFDRIADRLKHYDAQDYLRLIVTAATVATLVVGSLVYSYVRLKHKLAQRYAQLGKEQALTGSLLAQHAIIMQQRETVDALLAKDPNFKIKQFFTELIAGLGLQSLVAKEPEAAPLQDLVAGYGELKLEVALTHTTMQQLVTILNKIGEQERVYVKELRIVKAPDGTFIDASLTLATFERSAPV